MQIPLFLHISLSDLGWRGDDRGKLLSKERQRTGCESSPGVFLIENGSAQGQSPDKGTGEWRQNLKL